MMKAEVTVIIPTYNREKTLPRAIDSVISQIYKNWKLLIVDDCSTDNSIENITKKYDDVRIRVFSMEKNGGANRARNRGVRESKTKYISFLDSDDVLHPKALEMQIRKFEKENIGVCYVGADYFYGEEKRGTVHPMQSGNLELFLYNNLKGLGASTSGFMVERKVFEKIGFFDTAMPAQQDLDFLVRASRFFSIDYVKDCNTKMYLDVGNRISDNLEAVLRGEVHFLNKHIERIKELGVYHHVARKLARKYALYGNDMKNACRLLLSAIKYKPLYFYAYVYIIKLPLLYFKKK